MQSFCSLVTIKISPNIQMNKLFDHSDSETKNLVSFQIKWFSYTVISSYSQKMSALTIPKFPTSTRTVIMLQTIIKNLTANKMCSTVDPVFGTSMALLNLLSKCTVRKECVLETLQAIKYFSVCRQKWLSFSSMLVYVSGAESSLRRINMFVFLNVWPRNL